MRCFMLLALVIFTISGCSAAPQPLPVSTLSTPTLPPTDQAVNTATAWVSQATPTDARIPQVVPVSGSAAFVTNRSLARGVNFGDTLEAPQEGAWGVTLEASYFKAIKEAGFSAVRVPIGWTFHALKDAPYTIDAGFFSRIDWVVSQAQENHLLVILDMHNYPEMMEDPAAEKPRFLALWQQIAVHYQSAPDSVLFELLNEPTQNLDYTIWNALLKEVIPIVRVADPQRILVIGPAGWNSINYLDWLELPQDDQNIIVTVHYYSPMQVTHQGADWVDGSQAWLGTTWDDTVAERAVIRTDIDQAVAWAVQHNRPLFLGEFGCLSTADAKSRLAWTRYMVHLLESRQVSWGYWNFADSAGSAPGFGAFDLATHTWRQPLLDALISTH
jgi:endoglucanase